MARQRKLTEERRSLINQLLATYKPEDAMGSRKVVSGVDEGIYEPDRNMNRAEFAAIIVKALGLEPGVGTKSFSDVRSSDWYDGYVKTQERRLQ